MGSPAVASRTWCRGRFRRCRLRRGRWIRGLRCGRSRLGHLAGQEGTESQSSGIENECFCRDPLMLSSSHLQSSRRGALARGLPRSRRCFPGSSAGPAAGPSGLGQARGCTSGLADVSTRCQQCCGPHPSSPWCWTRPRWQDAPADPSHPFETAKGPHRHPSALEGCEKPYIYKRT